jgi:hypothetical protein
VLIKACKFYESLQVPINESIDKRELTMGKQIVEIVYSAFKYEMMDLYCKEEGVAGSLEVRKVDRTWVQSLYEELCHKGWLKPDNKVGFVFKEKDSHHVTAIVFWDFKARWIQWDARYWKGVPANLACRFEYGVKRERPSPRDIGLIKGETI